MTDIVLRGGEGKDNALARDISVKLESIRAGAPIPEVLNLFRTRHARLALVARGNRAEGIITTTTVLERIAGL